MPRALPSVNISRGSVYFRAPLSFAATLERIICADFESIHKLSYEWNVTATFDNQFELAFIPSSPFQQDSGLLGVRDIWLAVVTPRVYRDPATLAQIVNDL